ncbi:MAG: hypothetical protein KGJ88_09435 [Verrucomicrobiota bacterium]|nr:hypothetical protein [Verrucomicrobiota bacterium]
MKKTLLLFAAAGLLAGCKQNNGGNTGGYGSPATGMTNPPAMTNTNNAGTGTNQPPMGGGTNARAPGVRQLAANVADAGNLASGN